MADINFEDIEKIVKNNKYFKSTKPSNKVDKIDVNDLAFLVKECNLSKIERTKVEKFIEEFLIDFIKKFTTLSNTPTYNDKGVKVCNHVFLDDEKNLIHYAELKANINIDKKKAEKLIEKINTTYDDLMVVNEKMNVNYYLVNTRYLSKNDIPNDVRMKYIDIYDDVIGLNDYLDNLGIDVEIDYDTYKDIIVMFVNKLRGVNEDESEDN